MLFSKLNQFKAYPIILSITCTFLFSKTACAQCNSQIGELQVLNYQHEDGNFICFNDTLKVKVENYELTDSQQLYFVYHDKQPVLNANIMRVDTLKTDGFVNADLALDTVYVTAIASKAKSFNWLEDSCAVFSNTVEAFFLEPIILHHNFHRSPYNDEYFVQYFLTGGLAEIIDSSYIVTGEYIGSIKPYEIKKIHLKYTYDFGIFVVNDGNGCWGGNNVTIDWWLPHFSTSFWGEIVDEDHKLNWVTNYDTDIDFFLLEVSKNGNDFELLDTIFVTDTDTSIGIYSTLNENKSPGIYKYKLSFVRQNVFYWEVDTIELINYTTNLHPNPAQSILNFHFSGSLLDNINFQVYDLSGRKLRIDETQIGRNSHGFAIDISTLPNGIYLAHIQTEALERIEKFVVQK